MGQSRLSYLALLSIKNEMLKDIDFNMIGKFVALKIRKGNF